ncbi:hypothetical protein [Ralstonia chuxiongensis]|uniref:hypothetical protein n=1 Tax=Ralstonia chuxiongensis TaxID=2957504 RepID=UPI0028F583EB|nr:hypothetical protein [Ralstonia chuxiongensis]CAJ0781429.1 hypothetical protein R8510_04872 [Ralstonia chuxiongensis]
MKLGTALIVVAVTLGCTGLFARYLNRHYVVRPSRGGEVPVATEMRGDAVPTDAAEQLAMHHVFTGGAVRGQGAAHRSDRWSQ